MEVNLSLPLKQDSAGQGSSPTCPEIAVHTACQQSLSVQITNIRS